MVRASKSPAAGRPKAGKRAARPRGKLAPPRLARGLAATEIALPFDHADIAPLVALVRAAGGAPIGAYREPLGGHPLLLAALPLAAVQPTPFQRDLSPTHARRLADRIEEAGEYLDPLIVVRGEDGRLWTPNGRHRLAAAKTLGLQQITALISPEEPLAYRILALNTEKAHNLKDRSLEVIRMARNLAKRRPEAREVDFSAQFEAPELLTLGIVYESQPRFAGGAYSPFLRKVDAFASRPLAASLRERENHAARLLEIEAAVKRIAAELEARGFKSPYLRNYVVARINPVRFVVTKRGARSGRKADDAKPVMPIAAALTRMAAAAKKFPLDSVSSSDLAWVAVGAGGDA